ncbi:MAG: hypothetical protein HUU20_08565, partial [Pirellulales bacterium]|nr:hypothetical protein [Pirellulales bacterium]
ALYWKRTTAAGAIASVLTAVAALAAIVFVSTWTGKDETELLYGIMPVAVMLPASAAALVLFSLVTRPPAQHVLERYFPTARSNPIVPSPELVAREAVA